MLNEQAIIGHRSVAAFLYPATSKDVRGGFPRTQSESDRNTIANTADLCVYWQQMTLRHDHSIVKTREQRDDGMHSCCWSLADDATI